MCDKDNIEKHIKEINRIKNSSYIDKETKSLMIKGIECIIRIIKLLLRIKF